MLNQLARRSFILLTRDNKNKLIHIKPREIKDYTITEYPSYSYAKRIAENKELIDYQIIEVSKI